MIEPTIAARADYADAILVARRAKNWLFLLLVVVLLGQIALFFAARQTDFVQTGTIVASTTQPAGEVPVVEVPAAPRVLQYLVAISGYAGLIGSLLLCIMMLLLVKIMLTAHTLGVGRLTSAVVWSVILFILLFPWQAILANPTNTADRLDQDFKLPGVLYTWGELTHDKLGAKFSSDTIGQHYAVLRWARFVGFPLVATFILLSIQIKSSKGIKSALGEDEPVVKDIVRTTEKI